MAGPSIPAQALSERSGELGEIDAAHRKRKRDVDGCDDPRWRSLAERLHITDEQLAQVNVRLSLPAGD